MLPVRLEKSEGNDGTHCCWGAGGGNGTLFLQGYLTMCINIENAGGLWFLFLLEIYPKEIIGHVHHDICIKMLILVSSMQAAVLKHL